MKNLKKSQREHQKKIMTKKDNNLDLQIQHLTYRKAIIKVSKIFNCGKLFRKQN